MAGRVHSIWKVIVPAMNGVPNYVIMSLLRDHLNLPLHYGMNIMVIGKVNHTPITPEGKSMLLYH